MGSLKIMSWAFTGSVAIHAVLAYAFLSAGGALPPTDQSIQVDIVRVETVSAAQHKALPATPKTASPQKKEPAHSTTPEPAPTLSKTEFQKAMDAKIMKQLKELKRLETPPAPATPGVSAAMSSAELLRDPVKGKVFLSYFSQVKRKIQSAVYEKTARSNFGKGSVCLGFVLSAQGRLEKVVVIEKGTEADEMMRALAVNCLRDSSPFGLFPKDLGPGRISFNITIFFDGTE